MSRKEARKEKRKNKKGLRYWLMTLLSIILAVAGVTMLATPLIGDYILSQKIQAQEKSLAEMTVEDFEANQQAEASFDFNDVQLLSLETILQASQSNAKVQAIGEIAIPSVEINLTIAKGVSDLNMAVGAGTLRPDQQMGKGNYPLASHSYGGGSKLLFTPLMKIKHGAKVYLTDLKNVYIYEIYWTDIVLPNRVDLVEDTPGDNIITLITCDDGNADRRFIARGRLVSQISVSDASEEIIEAFKLTKHTLH